MSEMHLGKLSVNILDREAKIKCESDDDGFEYSAHYKTSIGDYMIRVRSIRIGPIRLSAIGERFPDRYGVMDYNTVYIDIFGKGYRLMGPNRRKDPYAVAEKIIESNNMLLPGDSRKEIIDDFGKKFNELNSYFREDRKKELVITKKKSHNKLRLSKLGWKIIK